MKHKHLISFSNWSADEVNEILELSTQLKQKRKNGEIIEPLKQKTLFMLFYEQSTRTRNSLEAAMTQLGGHAHDLTVEKMQISHGETAKDTAKVLSRMGEAIAVRNCFFNQGNKYLNQLKEHSDIPVISMQDDIYHPLQAIADMMTINEVFYSQVTHLKVSICWTYATTHLKPLSVPHSQLLMFPKFGIDLSIAHPPEFPLMPEVIEKAEEIAQDNQTQLNFVDNLEAALDQADIIIPKNWGGFLGIENFKGREEQIRAIKSKQNDYQNWILDEKLYKLAKPNAKIMHALPADRNHEVTDRLLDSENSVIYQEAENRLHTAKAILTYLMT